MKRLIKQVGKQVGKEADKTQRGKNLGVRGQRSKEKK